MSVTTRTTAARMATWAVKRLIEGLSSLISVERRVGVGGSLVWERGRSSRLQPLARPPHTVPAPRAVADDQERVLRLDSASQGNGGLAPGQQQSHSHQ
jgi:hypothetical protein